MQGSHAPINPRRVPGRVRSDFEALPRAVTKSRGTGLLFSGTGGFTPMADTRASGFRLCHAFLQGGSSAGAHSVVGPSVVRWARMDERRRDERVAIDMTLSFYVKGQSRERRGVGKNISVGGMHIETLAP